MRFLSAVALGLLIAAINTNASTARAGMEEDCVQEQDWNLKIGGCNAVIQSGQYSGRGLAAAYNNRGLAYRSLGEYRRAIEDYDQAIRIDPGLASAYQNRGFTYDYLGDFERAARDWERAIRIDGASRAKRWQQYLKGKGHYAGAIDGIFGPISRRALTACAVDPNC